MIIPDLLLKWREPKNYFKISKLTNKKTWRYWLVSFLINSALFSLLLFIHRKNREITYIDFLIIFGGSFLITLIYYLVDNLLRPEVKIFKNKKQTWFLKTNGVNHKQIYFKDLEYYAIEQIEKNGLTSTVLLLILNNGNNEVIGTDENIVPKIESIMLEHGIKKINSNAKKI